MLRLAAHCIAGALLAIAFSSCGMLEPPPSEETMFFVAAASAMETGDTTETQVILTKAFDKQVSSPGILALQGDVCSARREFGEAARWYKTAIDLWESRSRDPGISEAKSTMDKALSSDGSRIFVACVEARLEKVSKNEQFTTTDVLKFVRQKVGARNPKR